jgi:hypothetical protein
MSVFTIRLRVARHNRCEYGTGVRASPPGELRLSGVRDLFGGHMRGFRVHAAWDDHHRARGALDQGRGDAAEEGAAEWAEAS